MKKDNTIKQLISDFPLQVGEGNEILRVACKEVVQGDKKAKKLYSALIDLMREYDGVGLAAPQVGQNYRMCAVTQRNIQDTGGSSGEKRDLTEEFVMVNPVILSSSNKRVVDSEACLSLPGVKGDVERPLSITYQYEDIRGKKYLKKAIGFNARVVLHEVDHLDGILFIDKLAY